ncbi:MAG: AMP-binding protein [bacterium]|nr:cyclohexanecarboxylate-CoA ligase [Deltaproteobacteria bacterium]MCP4903997.1 AMP-binding protein [bacterium]
MSERFPRSPPHLARHYRDAGFWRDALCDEALFATAETRPDSTALIDRLGPMSWSELATRVRGCAAGLRELEVARGDTVSWVLPNWREAAIVHWALLHLGALSNPIVPIYRHREIRFILTQAESSVIVIPSEFRNFDYATMLAELRPELPRLRQVVTVAPNGSPPKGGDLDFEELTYGRTQTDSTGGVDRSPDDPALLLYTSGTTADPKGAIHTHNTLDFELRSMIEFYALDTHDVIYMPSPLSHVTGLLYGIQMPALLGGSVVYQDHFDPDRAIALLEEHACTFSVGATPFLHGLCEAQRRSPRPLALRTFCCGGADVPPDLIREASKTLGCLANRAYGSTEFPTLTGGNQDDSEARRAETDGRVMAHCEVRVVDEEGREVAAGETGELLARGPELFTGYLADVGLDAFDEHGWFSTGDLVSIKDGYLRVEGRRKDIIIRGGENISVKEIEDLLYAHPDVEEVAVVAMPDPVLVERVCAFVVPGSGCQPTLAELVDSLRKQKLANQKLPERMELVEDLPKTASGKVQKHRLRARIRERLERESG